MNVWVGSPKSYLSVLPVLWLVKHLFEHWQNFTCGTKGLNSNDYKITNIPKLHCFVYLVELLSTCVR